MDARTPKTLYDKIWESHLVHEAPGEASVIYIDRHLVHEVTSAQAFEGLRETGRKARRPELALAVADHNVPTTDRSHGIADPESALSVATLENNAKEFGIEFFGMNDIRQGIVHIIGPEQGWTLPGLTIVCGDSHTATHGAFGSLAFGIGTSEVEHVLATQTLMTTRSKNMRVNVTGKLPIGVTAKDIILAIIAKIGTAGGTGYVIEYAGDTIRALSMEGRMTVCNMSIEAGARAGLIAADETTFDYLRGRPRTPKGGAWEMAVKYWRTLKSDEGAKFDAEVTISRQRDRAHGHLGHQPGAGAAHHGARARSGRGKRFGQARRHEPRPRLYGFEARHAVARGQDRPRLHRLLHQWPHRGFARGRQDRRARIEEGPQSRLPCRRHGGAGLGPGEGTGGSRKASTRFSSRPDSNGARRDAPCALR